MRSNLKSEILPFATPLAFPTPIVYDPSQQLPASNLLANLPAAFALAIPD
jgi:hypothetical protein